MLVEASDPSLSGAFALQEFILNLVINRALSTPYYYLPLFSKGRRHEALAREELRVLFLVC